MLIELSDKMCECQTLDHEDLNTSDHNALTLLLNFGEIERTMVDLGQKSRINWKKLKPEMLKIKYSDPLGNQINYLLESWHLQEPNNALIDESFDKIIELFKHYEKVIPRSTFKKHLRPYWCEELNILKIEKVKRFKEWCQVGRPRDPTDPHRISHLNAKKAFSKKLKILAKGYRDTEIQDAVRSAEFNRNTFWRLLKKTKSDGKASTSAIKNDRGDAVYDVDQVLVVWRKHFSKLCTPKVSQKYDEDHFGMVTACTKQWLSQKDNDPFLENDFSKEQIRLAVSKLNAGKSPGHDGLTKEHLVAAVEPLIDFLHLIIGWILKCEYIPLNFRIGVQIPLHKGKNLPFLDPNSYRGITLLSTFNKVFEILLWSRIENWWLNSDININTQCACKKGVSSIHTALLLQETISSQLEANKKVYVAYLDVSKTFDSVWIDGHFYQLYQNGLRGNIWRLLYKCYINFRCRVRIHEIFSDLYTMSCGIHQGGFLSLVKYIAFINSLLVSLKESNACCAIDNVKSSPVGYADDVAAASTSKNKMDRVLKIADEHSKKWRYDFNASKSAILAHGETEPVNKRNIQYRNYWLGDEGVKEKKEYDL